MFRGIIKLPSYIRIEVDEYELEQFVTRRYEKHFNEPPLKVEAARYPSEIDIVIYVKAVTDKKQRFANEISDKLSDDGLSNIVLVREQE